MIAVYVLLYFTLMSVWCLPFWFFDGMKIPLKMLGKFKDI